jgi:hypothetical protein
MNRRITTLIGAVAGAAAIAAGGATLAQAQPVDSLPGDLVPVASPAAVQRSAQHTATAKVRLAPSSTALAACFPHASAQVKVSLTTDKKGKDTFTIKARGLKPRTDFTVFLVEQAGAPFGAAEYIGDFTTNRHGQGDNSFKLIVEEAFAFNNATHTRTDLNSVGVWFADPKDDDSCLGPNSPVTGFDGDADAGVQMLNSGVQQLP